MAFFMTASPVMQELDKAMTMIVEHFQPYQDSTRYRRPGHRFFSTISRSLFQGLYAI
jgi:hypothetical protein